MVSPLKKTLLSNCKLKSIEPLEKHHHNLGFMLNYPIAGWFFSFESSFIINGWVYLIFPIFELCESHSTLIL